MTEDQSPAALSAITIKRIHVLRIRQRVESVATEMLTRFERTFPTVRTHRHIRSRLLLLLALAPAYRWVEVRRVALRAGAVYRGCSDVLHGRRAFFDVPVALIDEWRQVTEELESLAEQLLARHPSDEVTQSPTNSG